MRWLNMASKRVNFTLSDKLLKKLNKKIPHGQRSQFMEDAANEYFEKADRLQYIKSLKKKKPIWSDENHPDLMTPEDFRNYRHLLWGYK